MDFTAILTEAGLGALALLLPALIFATEKAVDLLSYYLPQIPPRHLPTAALVTGVIIAFAGYVIAGETPDTAQEIVALIAAGMVSAVLAKVSHDIGDAAQAGRE